MVSGPLWNIQKSIHGIASWLHCQQHGRLSSVDNHFNFQIDGPSQKWAEIELVSSEKDSLRFNQSNNSTLRSPSSFSSSFTSKFLSHNSDQFKTKFKSPIPSHLMLNFSQQRSFFTQPTSVSSSFQHNVSNSNSWKNGYINKFNSTLFKLLNFYQESSKSISHLDSILNNTLGSSEKVVFLHLL